MPIALSKPEVERLPGESAAFRRDIQGLRAVAVLLVVWYHLGFPGLRGGFVGVDVFFVISGYLITGLLVREIEKTGRIRLSAFYARRARRLLPAALAMVAITVLAGVVLLSPIEQAGFASSAAAASGYVSNLRYIHSAGNYFGPQLESDPFLHTWSLAVEEQFYLAWPVLIALAFAAARNRTHILIAIGIVVAASLSACILLTRPSPTQMFFGSPARAWEFGVGGLASFLALRRSGWKVTASWIGLASVVSAAALLSHDTLFPGWLALLPVLGTALLLLAKGTGAARLLSGRTLNHIGELSYSWYLWHWPVLVFARVFFPSLTFAERIACALISLTLAELSFRFVETPIRFHQALVHSPRRSLAFGSTLTLSGVILALAARTFARFESSLPRYAPFAEPAIVTSGELTECAEWIDAKSIPCSDSTSNKPTIVLFGDSHAAMWLPALQPLARTEGWRLISMTKGACPSAIVRISARYPWDPDFPNRCAAWRNSSLGRIRLIRPDLVVIANSQEHVQGSRRKDERKRLTPAQWQQGMRQLLNGLAGTRTIVIRDAPRLGVNVPMCLSRAVKQSWRRIDCESTRVAALDSAVFKAELAAASGIATVIDASNEFCNTLRCYPIRNGVVAFRDEDHISRRFAASLRNTARHWIEPNLIN